MMMMPWAMDHLDPPEAERGQKDAPKSSHPGAVRAVFQYISKDKVDGEKSEWRTRGTTLWECGLRHALLASNWERGWISPSNDHQPPGVWESVVVDPENGYCLVAGTLSILISPGHPFFTDLGPGFRVKPQCSGGTHTSLLLLVPHR